MIRNSECEKQVILLTMLTVETNYLFSLFNYIMTSLGEPDKVINTK